MRKDRIRKLATALVEGFTFKRGKSGYHGYSSVQDIKPGKVEFYMPAWISEGPRRDQTCNSSACVGGHAEIMFGHRKDSQDENGSFLLTKALGITDAEADTIILGEGFKGAQGMWGITAKRAAAVLRYFANTGEINWNIGLRNPRAQA